MATTLNTFLTRVREGWRTVYNQANFVQINEYIDCIYDISMTFDYNSRVVIYACLNGIVAQLEAKADSLGKLNEKTVFQSQPEEMMEDDETLSD